MKKLFLTVTILLFFLIFVFALEPQFVINSYPPFSYLENGTKMGFSLDVLNAIADELNSEITVDFMEWDDAFSKLKSGKNTAIPSIIMNDERKEMFKWVGPISIVKTSLYSNNSSDIVLKNLEDAKYADKICVVKDYYSERLLKDMNFENLLVFDTEIEAFKTFLENEDYLFPSNNFGFAYLLNKNSRNISDFNELLTFSLDFMYIAFSTDTEDKTIEKWQEGLDAIKLKGGLQEIYNKWLPREIAPGVQIFLTEEYPPLTYLNSKGKPAGFVTDIVEEINKRMKNEEKIFFASWDLIYKAALINSDVVLFSMAKTQEREDKFEWVGPVIKNTAYFYKNSASNLALPSIEYAKKVNKIATTSEWWTEQRLKELGFENLISYQTPEECVDALVKRDVDLSIFTDLTVEDIVVNSGHEMREIQEILPFESIGVYIGISKGTSEEFIDKFIKTYDSIVMDGTYSEIRLKYFLE